MAASGDIGRAALQSRKRKWLGTLCEISAGGSVLQMLLAAIIGVAMGLVTKRAADYDETKVRRKYASSGVCGAVVGFR